MSSITRIESTLQTRSQIKKKQVQFSPPLTKKIHQEKEQLQVLKSLASDPLKKYKLNISLEKQELEQIIQIQKYQKNKKTIFLDDMFEKQKSLLPSIFTKVNFAAKNQKPFTNQSLAFEKYLALVVQLYYSKSVPELRNDFQDQKIKGTRGRKAKNVQKAEESQEPEELTEENEDIQLSMQDILISPLRKKLIYEQWSPLEIAIFETSICRFGKQFGLIQSMVKVQNQINTKKYIEIVEFYRSWKTTSHYRIWKYYKNLYNKNKFVSWF